MVTPFRTKNTARSSNLTFMHMEFSLKTDPLVTQNSLFAALSSESRARLAPDLKLVALTSGKTLFKHGAPVTHVYFPIDAIVALVYLVDNGASSEISIIGNEGMVGIFSMMSDENSSNEAQVLNAGYAFSLPKKKMQDEFHNQASLTLFLKYIQSLFAQMSQTAVCNRHHTIDQQLCRLLLLSLDRLPCNNLTMTHDLIAQMLGVRRGGISEAASRLQKAGVISYHRGHITVLNRAALETLCCECYSVVKREIEKLFPPPIKHREPTKISVRLLPNTDPKCLECFKFSTCAYLKPHKRRKLNLAPTPECSRSTAASIQ